MPKKGRIEEKSQSSVAVYKTKRNPPNMLLDITMPRISDVEGIRHLKQRHPGALFVTFTVYDDKRISEAIQMGACLYLLTSSPSADLLKRLHELANGAITMSSEVARRVIGLLPDVHQRAPTNFGLTPHETRLLTLLVDGHNFKAVALVAGIKPTTVAWHMQRIYQKLHVHSKSEAVATALRNGITSSHIASFRFPSMAADTPWSGGRANAGATN